MFQHVASVHRSSLARVVRERKATSIKPSEDELDSYVSLSTPLLLVRSTRRGGGVYLDNIACAHGGVEQPARFRKAFCCHPVRGTVDVAEAEPSTV